MSNRTPHRQRNFSPLRDKTLVNVLCQLFVTEFGYENKVIFAEAMIERILETIDTFVKPASLLKSGQLLWMAVADDGRKHAFKPMKEIPQVPVILDLVTDDDLQLLADGEDMITVRRQRHARLVDQTHEQGGALAYPDLSAITLTSEWCVGYDVAHIEQAQDRLLPHRGVVHDAGRTISHKVEVIRLLEAGYLEPDIARKLSPVHSLRSVERYAQTYRNVLKLLEQGLAPTEVSGILNIGLGLVEAYINLVDEHHPEVIAENPHLHRQGDNPRSDFPRGHLT